MRGTASIVAEIATIERWERIGAPTDEERLVSSAVRTLLQRFLDDPSRTIPPNVRSNVDDALAWGGLKTKNDRFYLAYAYAWGWLCGRNDLHFRHRERHRGWEQRAREEIEAMVAFLGTDEGRGFHGAHEAAQMQTALLWVLKERDTETMRT